MKTEVKSITAHYTSPMGFGWYTGNKCPVSVKRELLNKSKNTYENNTI